AAARQGRRARRPVGRTRIIGRGMSRMVQVAVAGDTTEADEIQKLLLEAGIDSKVEPEEEADAVAIFVAEDKVEDAQDAVERTNVPPTVGLKQGSAEALPFRDGWFERLVMRTVVHLLDRQRALAEFHRVLARGGRLAVATFRPSHYRQIWLAAYFPSIEPI